MLSFSFSLGPRTETSVGLFTPGITGEAAGIAAIGGDGAIRFFPFKPLHLIADVDGNDKYSSDSSSSPLPLLLLLLASCFIFFV